MSKSFNLAGLLQVKGVAVKDPRVMMRVIIGILLTANLVAAVIAFKPFGGSADDLRSQQQALSTRLSKMQTQLAKSKQIVEKVHLARTEGDEFLKEYFMDVNTSAAMAYSEMIKSAEAAGVKLGQQSFHSEAIEGSDTLEMLTITVGVEGSYANVAKYINVLDKSPRFLIIESMQAAAPQQQQGVAAAAMSKELNVSVKIDTFVNNQPGVVAP
jgi:Tfp pilus assembly protein PilO